MVKKGTTRKRARNAKTLVMIFVLYFVSAKLVQGYIRLAGKYYKANLNFKVKNQKPQVNSTKIQF